MRWKRDKGFSKWRDELLEDHDRLQGQPDNIRTTKEQWKLYRLKHKKEYTINQRRLQRAMDFRGFRMMLMSIDELPMDRNTKRGLKK